jgi:hypothetical protein
MLQWDVLHEQRILIITEVSDGCIYFKAGQKKTNEEILVHCLQNTLYFEKSGDELKRIKNLIYQLKAGRKMDEVLLITFLYLLARFNPKK